MKKKQIFALLIGLIGFGSPALASQTITFNEDAATVGYTIDLAGTSLFTVIDLTALGADRVVDLRVGDPNTFSVVLTSGSPRLITVKSNLTLAERKQFKAPDQTNIIAITRSGKVFLFTLSMKNQVNSWHYSLAVEPPTIASLIPALPQTNILRPQPRPVAALPADLASWQRWFEVASRGQDPSDYGYSLDLSPPVGFDERKVQVIADTYTQSHLKEARP